jgi:hypothetical protein
MGKNSDPTRGCYGKQQFRSFGVAELAAEKARKRRGERLLPYRCRHCQRFHFGHVSKQQARRTHRVLLTSED